MSAELEETVALAEDMTAELSREYWRFSRGHDNRVKGNGLLSRGHDSRVRGNGLFCRGKSGREIKSRVLQIYFMFCKVRTTGDHLSASFGRNVRTNYWIILPITGEGTRGKLG